MAIAALSLLSVGVRASVTSTDDASNSPELFLCRRSFALSLSSVDTTSTVNFLIRASLA